MNAIPKVTVLLCIYNGEPYLQSSIESILNQTFEDFELLIINDGSTDRSVDVIKTLKDSRIRLINNEKNQGLISCLNQGIAVARGEFLARQDSDDLSLGSRLEKQVKYLELDEKTVLVGTWLTLIDENGIELAQWKYPEHPLLARWALLFDSPVGHSSVMFKVEVARKLGGYSRNHTYAEDYEFWSRMSRWGEIVSIPQILQLYRIHSESVSSKNKEAQEKMRVMISKGNIAKYVGEVLDNNVIEFLANKKIKPNVNLMSNIIDGYQILLDRFAISNQIDEYVKGAILNDIVLRIGNTLQQIGIGDRIQAITKKRDFFPANFWLTGKFLLFVTNKQFKDLIKQFIGK